MRDRDVPEPILNCPRVDAVVGQLVTAAMPQHVEVHRQRQAGTLADNLDQPVDGIRRERRAALGASLARIHKKSAPNHKT
jgi:hypothetical protein